MIPGEIALLCSSVLWFVQHALQAETRVWFIRRMGANLYLSVRYAINLTWLGANTVATGLLYAHSPLVWEGSTIASAVLLHASLVVLVAVLIIPGSPSGTNAKIAHSRQGDKMDGSRMESDKQAGVALRNRAPSIVHDAEVQVSSLCKISNQPQLLALIVFIVAMLTSPTKRVHLLVWLPQLTLIGVGIPLQLRRMGKDKRYALFFAQTHWVPMLALVRGHSTWTRFDSYVLALGVLPPTLLLGALLGVSFFWDGLSTFYVGACIAHGSPHDCHVQALGVEFVYISLLVLSAEMGARLRIFILPTGSGPVFGTRLWDVENKARAMAGIARRPSVRASSLLDPVTESGVVEVV